MPRNEPLVLALAITLCTATVSAQAFQQREQIELGAPPRAIEITATATPEGVELRAGKARAQLPLTAATEMSVERVDLGPAGAVAIATLRGDGGQQAAALISQRGGRAKVVWSGALGLRGDVGERHGHAIEVSDRTGDGIPDVIVGELSERAHVCGEERTLLRPQAFDPQRAELRPVTLEPLATSTRPIVELRADAQGPGLDRPPLVDNLVPTGASSQPGVNEAWMANPPTAVADGDPATAWSEGRGAGGRGEFVSFRWNGGARPLRTLAITPVPDPVPSVPWSRVRVLWLAGDSGPRLKVTLPDDAAPGARYWVTPPEPMRIRCLSAIVAEAVPVPPARRGVAVLAEVQAYTDLDFGEGLKELVSDLNVSGERASSAADMLVGLGAAALPALIESWPKLTKAARRRAVRVFAHDAARETIARDALVTALDDAESEVRDAALEALLAGGAATQRVLLPKVLEGGDLGDRAAIALARSLPVETVDTALAALSARGGSERPVLRDVLALACQHAGTAALEPIEHWQSSETATAAARAAAALALSGVQQPVEARALAAKMVAATTSSAQEFGDVWRLVQAARALPATDDVDVWLARIATADEHWMLRAAAVEALVERGSSRAAPAAKAAMRDKYPRVRVAGAGALRGDASATDRLIKHAQRDLWPMVRAAAFEALAPNPKARALLPKGLEDRSRTVRAAALRALTAAKAREAWPAVRARMESENEWPMVTTEAVKFARELCIHEAGEPLLGLLERGLKPNPWEPDVDVALVAFEALVQIGGKPAKHAISLAGSPSAPPGFKAAVESARKQKSECSP